MLFHRRLLNKWRSHCIQVFVLLLDIIDSSICQWVWPWVHLKRISRFSNFDTSNMLLENGFAYVPQLEGSSILSSLYDFIFFCLSLCLWDIALNISAHNPRVTLGICTTQRFKRITLCYKFILIKVKESKQNWRLQVTQLEKLITETNVVNQFEIYGNNKVHAIGN